MLPLIILFIQAICLLFEPRLSVRQDPVTGRKTRRRTLTLSSLISSGSQGLNGSAFPTPSTSTRFDISRSLYISKEASAVPIVARSGGFEGWRNGLIRLPAIDLTLDDIKGHSCHRKYSHQSLLPRLHVPTAALSLSPRVRGTSLTLLYAELTVFPGVFIVNDTFELTLTQNAVFKPQCTGGSSGIVHGGFSDNATVTDLRTPFYASTTPQIFAIAVATVVSYFLVILIFITPRTFFVGGPGGGAGFLTRRGLSGSSSIVGVGRRPLLQKIAAVTVAVSMTIATADTFSVAKQQYEEGFMDSDQMVRSVVGGLEIRVVQVISDTFLWLAQVQTLIRLFPRHKEKVTIKWLGFALILLDVIFSSLNNFLIPGTNTRPRNSRDAIPALSYLFELAIGFIYASCVIYYAMSKYRFAFYHAKMRNICLVALLSITSVLIPVVFFVIDVSSPDIATWGFYIRWVGAAAASVVVWEWVERIEALERDERKDGILGREVYDGDEMLEVTTANGVDWPGRRSRRHSDGSNNGGNTRGLKDRFGFTNNPLRSRMPFYNRQKRAEVDAANVADTEAAQSPAEKHASNPAPPAAVATPVSRADTTSAASTVYAVRYHNMQTPQIPEDAPHGPVIPKETSVESTSDNSVADKHNDEHTGPGQVGNLTEPRSKPVPRPLWTAVSHPFKRKRASPPAEVAGAQMLEGNSHRRSPAAIVNSEKWSLRSRMGAFTTARRDKLGARRQAGKVDDPLPVTIIPAQPRGTRTWSPDDLADVSDGVRPVQAHSGIGHTHSIVEPSRNGVSMNITFLPTATGGTPARSAEDAHHNEVPPPLDGGISSVMRHRDQALDGEPPPGVDQISYESQQPVLPSRPPQTVGTRSDVTNGSSPPSATALTVVEPASQPQRRRSSLESNTNDLHMQSATTLEPDLPDVSLPQPPQLSSFHRSRAPEDARTFPDGGQPATPMGAERVIHAPARPVDSAHH